MKTYQTIATGTMAALLTFSPMLASANEGIRAEAKLKLSASEKKEMKDERRADGACLKAFGHLFAKGFIKNKGEVEIDWSNCFVPFGIAKKRNHASSTATSTADVTAPVISAIKTFVSSTTARIVWATSERATSSVSYRPSNATTTAAVAASADFNGRLHTVVLKNLAASTTYDFRISATDKAGNSTTSATASFTTK